MQNITKMAEEDLAKAKEKMTEQLKEKAKEKPAVNKRKREETKPKKAEPNFFEEGVELRETALNVEVLKAATEKSKRSSSLQKRKRSEGIDAFGGYDSNIPLFVVILGKLRAAAMVHGIEPKEFSFPITKQLE